MEDNNTQLSAATFQQPQVIQPGMPSKTPPLLQRFTKEQIEEAIEKSFGITTAICQQLDCTYAQLWRALHKLGLESKLQEAKKQIVALAESNLVGFLGSTDDRCRMEATKFVLSRLGRNDGYGDQPMIAVEVNTDEKRAQIRALFGIKDQNGQQESNT